MKSLYLIISKLFLIGFFSTLFTFVGMSVLLLPKRYKASMYPILHRIWADQMCKALKVHIKMPHIKGLYNPSKNHLIISNHETWLDIIIIASLYPTVFLAKQSVIFWPVVGWGAWVSGTLFFNRSSKNNRKNIRGVILRRLAEGYTITVFPQGTTWNKLEPGAFKWGIFEAAKKSDSEVVVLSLTFRDKVLPWTTQPFLENFFYILKQDRIDVEVDQLDVFAPDNQIDGQQLAQRIEKTIIDHKYQIQDH